MNDKSDAELLRGIEQQVVTVARSPNRAVVETKILDVFKHAADMIRDVHKLHESQSETLAQHIENIGKDFNDLCKKAAEEVRHLRITPQAHAEKTADELVYLGETEQERHQVILQGMNSIQGTLRTMSDHGNEDRSAGNGGADTRGR